jgi:hypothetical protein
LPIGLKRRLQLDDETLDDFIDAKKLAVDEDGRVLVWTGGTAGASPPPAPLPNLAGSRRSAPQPHRRRPRLWTPFLITSVA